MNETLRLLGLATDIFVKANVAAPIITGTVMSIAAIIRGVTGSGPGLPEIADMLEQKLGQNDANIRAEIVRMEGLLPPA